MASQTGKEGWAFAPKYIIGALIGALVFVAAPEGARWLHGGAFAQSPQQLPGGGNCNNYGTFNGTMNNNCPTYNMPPRRPEGLYQSDQMVGLVGGVKPGQNPNQVVFQNLRISSGTVDLSAPLEFQNARVSCPMPQRPGMAAMTVIAIAGDITCDIIGPRQ
jgi:hypothetical protein